MQNEKTKKTKLVRKLVALAIIITFGLIILIAIQSQKNIPTAVINNVEIKLEIATTSQEKIRGLCCRNSLAKNSGMLFVYKTPGDHRFWMKDTLIPLDMYWIDKNNKIVHIEHSVQPSSYPKTFGTKHPSLYTLETNAGFAKIHNIQIGDTVVFKKLKL